MRALPAALATLSLAAAACAPNGDASRRPSGSTTSEPAGPTATVGDTASTGDQDATGDADGTGGAGRFPRALAPFADCSAFLDHVKAEATERVGPYGLGDHPWMFWEDVALAEDTWEMAERAATDDAGADADGPTPSDGTAAANAGDGGFTGTNVQELGVDEPDIVKTDGERILAVSENRLTYVDVTGEARVTDAITIPEGWGHELFISGERALLFTNGGQWGTPMPLEVEPGVDAELVDAPMPDGEGSGPSAVIIEIDLSNPDDLRVAASMRIEGQYLSARAIGDKVRLAVSSAPTELPWLYPQNENGFERATEANRRIIAESTLDDWLPDYELVAGDVSTAGPLLSCQRAHHPADFSGFDMISIVELSLVDGLARSVVDAVGVLAGGQTVYSSTDRMYVATTKWVGADAVGDDAAVREWHDDHETDLHAFAISSEEPARYVASGTIAGSLLNQFSMDEHGGYLRVITTDGSPWGAERASETHLVVFEEQGERLVPIGEVGGLGQGEQLYSARLMGDVGFAVTFRQIDPFYVLDLSDPRNPRVTGELKIPGVSTYLHPVGGDRVLGVGQDATAEGIVTGFKLSLFDVSNPADPREVAVWTLRDANSPVEWDHRAFQMIGSTAIVPVQQWSGEFNGAILFDIGDTITEIGRITHQDPGLPPSSDCRAITADDLTPEGSELWWMVAEGNGRVQVCEPGAVGGWGTNHYCDPIPVEELRYWYVDPAAAEADLAAIGAEPGDVIEICWPDGGHQQAIQRSLVIGDTLWTTTPSTIQANTLQGLATIRQLPLR